MNTINRTQLSLTVTAIFANGLNDILKGATFTPYESGLFAEQDYRTIISMRASVRWDLVVMQDGSDVPAMDAAKEGSMAANDTGADSEMEIERREVLKEAMLCHAVLERHLETVAKTAASDTEEAGKRTTTGGRYTISKKGREFRAYGDTFEEYLIGLKAGATPGTSWAIKIDRAFELVGHFPLVSAQEATDMFPDYFEDENVRKVSLKAWEKLLDCFARDAELTQAHAHDMATYNALSAEWQKTGASEIAVACKEYKRAHKSNLYWITRFMEPWQLLCATGIPAELVDSPEWRTAEAEVRVAKAKAKLAETNANLMELEALNMEAEAHLALRAARERMTALAARNTELHDKLTVPPVRADDIKVEVKTEPEPEVKAQPAITIGTPVVHSTRGSANGFRPRG